MAKTPGLIVVDVGIDDGTATVPLLVFARAAPGTAR